MEKEDFRGAITALLNAEYLVDVLELKPLELEVLLESTSHLKDKIENKIANNMLKMEVKK